MSTNELRATIFLATRNRAELLRSGLESVFSWDYPGVEVLVVDDDSTDETEKVFTEWSGKIRSFRIRRARMKGYRRNPSPVLNIGHAMARADVVIEQNPEVCHLTNCAEPLIEACRPGIVALARVHNGTREEMGKVMIDLAEGRYEFPEDVEPDPKTLVTNGDKHRVPRVGVSGTQIYCGSERLAPFLFLGAIHRDDFERVGGYNESLSSRNDENLANRLIASGIRFRFLGNAVAFHLSHGKS